MLGDELAHRDVGSVVDWYGSRSYEQTTGPLTVDLISPRSRNDRTAISIASSGVDTGR